MTKTSIGLNVSRPRAVQSVPNPPNKRLVRKSTRTKDSISNRRIAAALRAELSPDDLTGPEYDVWMREVNKKMAEPNERELEFFKERRRLGIGVGLDETGKIVYQKRET